MVKITDSVGFLAAGVALLYGGAAIAQTTGGSTKRLSGAVSATASYSSNVAGGGAEVAAVRGVTPGDVIYTGLVSGSFQLPAARETFFVNGSVGVHRHAQNSNLDGEDIDVSSGLSGRAGPCGVSVVGNFARAQTAPGDLLVAVTNNISETATANGALNCAAGPIVAGLTGSLSKVTNNSAGLVGTTSKSVGASLGYGNANFGVLSVTASYFESGFAQSPLPGQPAPSAPKQYGVGLSYGRKLGLRLNGSAAVSVVHVDSAGQISQGIDANVALSYRLSERASLNLGYSRGVEASQVVGATSAATQALNLSGTYSLSQRIGVHANVSGGTSKSEGGVALRPLAIRENRNLSESVGISLKVGRSIAASLDATHSSRTADVNAFNFSSNGVSISISNTF
jgi:hypothetical protein